MIYEPREDSYLLEEQVKKYSKGKSFLDMGAANGIQSLSALNAGAKSILAVDIQLSVIKFLKNKDIPAIQSDLFNNIEKKFDLIAFNPPYLPKDKKEDKESSIITSGGKKGDEIILRFLKQAPKHLNSRGKILLIVSSLTPRHRIERLLVNLNLKKKVLSQQDLFMEKLEVWEISAKQ
jgi:release factor glutamine methyltransferase